MSKDHWDLRFKQRIWLEWLKQNHPLFISNMNMEDMIDYVLMKGLYNKDQRERLNQLYTESKKID